VPAVGSMLSFDTDPQLVVLALTKEGRATDHQTFHCLSFHLLKLLCGYISDPLPVHNHHCGSLSPRYFGWMSQNSLNLIVTHFQVFRVAQSQTLPGSGSLQSADSSLPTIHSVHYQQNNKLEGKLYNQN
jgi:hypothetical protein